MTHTLIPNCAQHAFCWLLQQSGIDPMWFPIDELPWIEGDYVYWREIPPGQDGNGIIYRNRLLTNLRCKPKSECHPDLVAAIECAQVLEAAR